jgi:hypothetical protein
MVVVTLGGGPLHVDRVELFSLTEIDPMVQLDRPSARTVLDSVELIDGERYDQLYLEGETPDGERVRVCLGGGRGGRVEFFVISEGLGETHYLVRPGVEPFGRVDHGVVRRAGNRCARAVDA